MAVGNFFFTDFDECIDQTGQVLVVEFVGFHQNRLYVGVVEVALVLNNRHYHIFASVVLFYGFRSVKHAEGPDYCWPLFVDVGGELANPDEQLLGEGILFYCVGLGDLFPNVLDGQGHELLDTEG